MSVVMFKLEGEADVIVHNTDIENIKHYFMKTVEIIKRETIAECLREDLLRAVGIIES